MDPVSATTLFAEERKLKILQLLQERSKILVPELCEIFSVSPTTIRNDLRDMEREGKLKRTHGGAIPLCKSAYEPANNAKDGIYTEKKKRIAQMACNLVENGDTIILDTGSTTFELAKLLVNKQSLTIITNDIRIAAYLDEHSKASIIMLGGIVKNGFSCTMGSMAVSFLPLFSADKAFMATNAFSLAKGFATPNIELAEMKKQLMQISSENIMLMDSSKLGHNSIMQFAKLEDFDKLIIDDNIPDKIQDVIKESAELLLV